MISVFDDVQRDDVGPQLYAEPSFNYLNRSARPMIGRIRSVIELWFTHYPPGEQTDLRARLRSPDEQQHLSAFFELLLHELLLRLKCQVVVHPPLSTSLEKRPDFLVTSPSGDQFYLEATLATAESRAKAAARARINEVYDALNRLDSPNFFLGLSVRGAPGTPPSARDMKAFLRKKLADLDPDTMAELWESGNQDLIPVWTYQHDGWEIDFQPIPKSQKSRGEPGIRPIGLIQSEFERIDSHTPLREAIEEKAGRYGEMDLPYLVAVNALGDKGVDDIDVMEALFGQEVFVHSFGVTDSNDWVMKRKTNGVWRGPSGSRYTRVSGILLFVHLHPGTVVRSNVRLIRNPWASLPYSSVLCALPQWIVRNNRMVWQPGLSLAQILELDPSWPMESNQT